MKKTPAIILSVALSLLMMLSACDNQLDLAPEDTLTESAALGTDKTAEGVLGDAYTKLFDASKGTVYTLGDITTQISADFQGESSPLVTGAIEARDNSYGSIWNGYYEAINLANVIINELPKNAEADFDVALQQQFVAEAKFIRAFAYFDLLKLYGDGALQDKMENMGVPLRLQGYDGYDGSQDLPRSSNGEVYAQILKDLEEAAAALPETYAEPKLHFRASKGTALALASRAALYMKEYQKAVDFAEQVLNDADYTLPPSVIDVFPNNTAGGNSIPFSNGIVFAFPTSYNNDPTQYAKHDIYYGYGYVYPSESFIDSYADNDLRGTEMLLYNADSTKRIPIAFSHPQQLDNLVMLRMAEIVLNKAEALAYLNGVNQESINLLNKIHQRAFPEGMKPAAYTMADFSSEQELIARILQERRWELAFEGHDRYDKIRSGLKPNDVLPENRYALPIPQREIDITQGLIKQNPGY